MFKCYFTVLLLFLASVLYASNRAAFYPFSLPVASEAISGDANSDGSINIFDLLTLLKALCKPGLANPASDIDNNGTVDECDLVSLLYLLAGKTLPEDDLQFLVLINNHLLRQTSGWYYRGYEHQQEIVDNKISLPYRIYGNREIREVVFVLGGDTLRGLKGVTPAMTLTDTSNLESWSKTLTAGIIPWHVEVTDYFGNNSQNSGETGFLIGIIEPNTIEDPDFSYFGLPIDFPLVLRGQSQKFILSQRKYTGYEIDLNSASADSIVFPDIDSLATGIMNCLFAYYLEIYRETGSQPHLLFSAAPAIDRETGCRVNRLVFKDLYFGDVEILPINENEEILKAIGFPAWVRSFLPYFLPNLDFDSAWFSKYPPLDFPLE